MALFSPAAKLFLRKGATRASTVSWSALRGAGADRSDSADAEMSGQAPTYAGQRFGGPHLTMLRGRRGEPGRPEQ
jgi:hypothetical protein